MCGVSVSARSLELHRATWLAIVFFVTGVSLLVLVTTLEHSAPLRALFGASVGAAAYLGLQSALFLASLVFSGIGCWHGTTRDRLAVAIPAALMLLYFAALATGPG
jgi:hypothetical protein